MLRMGVILAFSALVGLLAPTWLLAILTILFVGTYGYVVIGGYLGGPEYDPVDRIIAFWGAILFLVFFGPALIVHAFFRL